MRCKHLISSLVFLSYIILSSISYADAIVYVGVPMDNSLNDPLGYHADTYNVDCINGDIGSQNANMIQNRNPQDIMKEAIHNCDMTSNCLGYSLNHSTGIYILKKMSSCSSNDQRTDDGFTFYRKTTVRVDKPTIGKEINGYIAEQDSDCPGGDLIKNAPRVTNMTGKMNVAINACNDKPTCKGISFRHYDGTYVLKTMSTCDLSQRTPNDFTFYKKIPQFNAAKITIAIQDDKKIFNYTNTNGDVIKLLGTTGSLLVLKPNNNDTKLLSYSIVNGDEGNEICQVAHLSAEPTTTTPPLWTNVSASNDNDCVYLKNFVKTGQAAKDAAKAAADAQSSTTLITAKKAVDDAKIVADDAVSQLSQANVIYNKLKADVDEKSKTSTTYSNNWLKATKDLSAKGTIY